MKAILFDLDGVLVDTEGLHREAFIHACNLFEVGMTGEEHDQRFNGLPTRLKLAKLVDEGRLAASLAPLVYEAKQRSTGLLIDEYIAADPQKRALLDVLHESGYQLGVVSNAIRSSVLKMLQRAGLMSHLSVVLSNEDVEHPKPAADGWWRAMALLGVSPEETLVIEDSPPGIASAYASGAQVMEVSGPDEVTSERILNRLRRGSEQRQGLAETGQSLRGDGSLLRASPQDALGAA